MKARVVKVSELELRVINNVMYRFIFDENSGSKCLIMRIAELPPGGEVSEHTHTDEEQAYYILSGRGIVKIAGEEYHIEPNHAVFIPLNTPHKVINTGTSPLVYIFFNAKIGCI
ncbi:MAG: cupin domain-containing protein [Ignisphaera sp.]